MKLEKKVHAVNEVQRLAELNFNHIIPILKQFIGQQIILKSGSKSAKFKKAISFLDKQPKQFGTDYARLHRVYLDITHHSVWLKISCSFKDSDTSCFYEEANIFVGNVENGILTEIKPDYPTFENYKLQEVRNLLAVKKRLEYELSEVKSVLHKFNGTFY